MNQTDLIARVRRAAYLETANVDFTDAVILAELNDQMTQLYENQITKSRQGYWLKQLQVPIVQGTDRYRVPARACTGGLERVEIAYDSTLDWQELLEVDEKLALNYELGVGQQGTVTRYCMRGDQINLLPDPNGANVALRLNYYVRPSRIVAVQVNPATSGVITAINTSTRLLTIAASVSSIAPDGTSTALATGNLIDVVSPSGWHELQLVGEPVIVAAGISITLTGTGDMSTIQVGDYVRAAEQSDWPALPDDYHRTIADAAAISILRTRGMSDRSAELESKLGGDLERFGDMLTPRVQSQAPVIVAPSMYRGRWSNVMPVKYP